MSKGLADMARIGQMVLDGDLVVLRELSERIDALRARVDELDAQLSARARTAAVAREEDLALCNGRDQTWVEWVCLQKAELRRQIAELMADREDKLARAKRSFGRAQAIEALQTRAREARLRKQSRQS
ncbi:hypothetical protein [Aliiroseovarius sp.]|uniref:hypothetical protein n=1 Tax=Aliiroseovarius sp. TaxID=1872442 RepID=UPI0026352177|nr:hypothetical protein [Aliiroseovarius sp.]